jgi:hypothetical protein
LGPGCAILDYIFIKEFVRWCSYFAQERKSQNGRPVITIVLIIRRLFGGFKKSLQIKIMLEDQKEISSVSLYVDSIFSVPE